MMRSAWELLMPRYLGQNSRHKGSHCKYSFSSRTRRRPSACAAEHRPAITPNACVCPSDTPSFKRSFDSILFPLAGDADMRRQKMQVFEKEELTSASATQLASREFRATPLPAS